MDQPQDDSRTLLVFDTDCVLCSGVVAFVLRHERDDSLAFVGAWSEAGQALAAQHGFSREDLNGTFLVIGQGGALARSTAALEVLRHLRAPWRWLRAARIVPRPIRDRLYDLVARNRYRWFGRRPDCVVVPPAQAARFIGLSRGP